MSGYPGIRDARSFSAMSDFTFFAFASKNIKRNAFRNSVLAFSITLVVCTLVFGLSVIVNVNTSIKRSADRLGADLMVIPVGASRFAEEVLLETESKSFFMDRGVVDRVRAIDGIAQVTSQTYLTTIPSLCCDIPESKIVAFNQDTDFIIRPWLAKVIGRRLEKGEAIAGYESYLNINRGFLEINANLFGNRFKVVGALDKTETGLDNAIFISDENIDDIIRNGKSTLRPDQVSLIFTKVKNGYDPYAVGRDIEGKMVDVDVISRKDIGKNIIAALRDIRQIFGLLVVLASLLSLFLVWSIFSAIANERSREVGIMRALGAKESHIVKVFFIEVMSIACLGGVLGAILGTAFTVVLGNSFSILRNLPNDLSFIERAVIALSGFGMGALICLGGALSPIQRIKKLEPLVVIKAE
ncbi:MAG TPA: FtsX-like permease family protein [Nitrospirota bacterium]|nr:FtsX-like permease family protein [Nitrospirota bacterium]